MPPVMKQSLFSITTVDKIFYPLTLAFWDLVYGIVHPSGNIDYNPHNKKQFKTLIKLKN